MELLLLCFDSILIKYYNKCETFINKHVTVQPYAGVHLETPKQGGMSFQAIPPCSKTPIAFK